MRVPVPQARRKVFATSSARSRAVRRLIIAMVILGDNGRCVDSRTVLRLRLLLSFCRVTRLLERRHAGVMHLGRFDPTLRWISLSTSDWPASKTGRSAAKRVTFSIAGSNDCGVTPYAPSQDERVMRLMQMGGYLGGPATTLARTRGVTARDASTSAGAGRRRSVTGRLSPHSASPQIWPGRSHRGSSLHRTTRRWRAPCCCGAAAGCGA